MSAVPLLATDDATANRALRTKASLWLYGKRTGWHIPMDDWPHIAVAIVHAGSKQPKLELSFGDNGFDRIMQEQCNNTTTVQDDNR